MTTTRKVQGRNSVAEDLPGASLISEISSELQVLGFSDYEARSYLALVKTSPSTAYDVSKTTGVPRANVYGALENLIKKGAVQMVGQKPAKFAAIAPQELMNNIAKATSSRCERIASLIKDVDTETNQDVVWTITGEEKVNSRISSMIDEAKDHIWIKASEDILEKHLAGLKAAHDRKVKIIIILFGTKKERFSFGKRIRVYLHEGDGFRVGSSDNLFTMTTDYSEAITVRMKDNYLGAHTRSGPFVTMAETIIRHDIYLAEIFTRFNAEIVGAFGPYLVNLRRSLFSKEQVALMNSRLQELGIIENPPSRGARRRG